MARFQFFSRPLPPTRATTSSILQRALRELPPEPAREQARGPGWFDSSFELTHGLDVREAGEAGYDDWLAARAIAERRAAARRPARTKRAAAPVARAEDDAMMDLADLVARSPAKRPVAAAPADDFSRFGIEGLALA